MGAMSSKQMFNLTTEKAEQGTVELCVTEERKQSGSETFVYCTLVTWHTHGEPSPQHQSHFPSLSSIKLLPPPSAS